MGHFSSGCGAGETDGHRLDEQDVQAIGINLREPVQPWCPRCPVIESRGPGHRCLGLKSWLTNCFSATRGLELAAHEPQPAHQVCGVSCWCLNTFKREHLWGLPWGSSG